MSIDDVIKAHGAFYGRDFTLCEDETERKFLIDKLVEIYGPDIHTNIELAIGYACRQLTPPRETKELVYLATQKMGQV